MATNFRGGRRYAQEAEFSPVAITGGAGSDAGSAAGIVSLGKLYGANRQSSMKPDEIVMESVAARHRERATITEAQAATHSAGMSSVANKRVAEIQAEAAKKAAQQQASGSMMGSALGAIGSIGGALMMSDRSTKDHVERIEDALSTLRQLEPVTFNYKEEYSTSPERMHHGFIAQDYRLVMPDATYYDESTDKLCIDTVDLIGLLVRAVQQLEVRVLCLEAQRALEGVN